MTRVSSVTIAVSRCRGRGSPGETIRAVHDAPRVDPGVRPDAQADASASLRAADPSRHEGVGDYTYLGGTHPEAAAADAANSVS
jgi:hypothetical protein